MSTVHAISHGYNVIIFGLIIGIFPLQTHS